MPAPKSRGFAAGCCYAFSVAKNSFVTNVEVKAGLCADCLHARSVKSDRGSTFILCELSARDPKFPKYPRIPVLSCEGYKKRTAGG